jgi:integrase
MASIYNKGTRTRPIWYVKWREAGRQCYQRVGHDREVAVRLALKIESDLVEGRYGIARREPVQFPTFASAATKWIERRRTPDAEGRPMVRSWKADQTRLKRYIIPFVGQKRLDQLQAPGWVKEFIEHVRPKIAAQTIRNCLNVIGRLFQDYIEDGLPLTNPVRLLDRATRRKVGPRWDPTKARFLDNKKDIRAVYLALPAMTRKDPWRAMFAVGVFAGLRPSEIRALEWGDIDSGNGLIHVRRTTSGPIKDDECRSPPLLDSLEPVLTEWRRLAPAGSALCFPATGKWGRYVKSHSMRAVLRKAFDTLGKPGLTWYASTRHTFASHWVMDGGSLEKLRHILGHSSFVVTERYAHLVPGRFSEHERGLVSVSLREGRVIAMNRGKKL